MVESVYEDSSNLEKFLFFFHTSHLHVLLMNLSKSQNNTFTSPPPPPIKAVTLPEEMWLQSDEVISRHCHTVPVTDRARERERADCSNITVLPPFPELAPLHQSLTPRMTNVLQHFMTFHHGSKVFLFFLFVLFFLKSATQCLLAF